MSNERIPRWKCNGASPAWILEELLRERAGNSAPVQTYLSIPELASRWRCSRGTVYNRLRLAGVKVLDFAVSGRKSKKLVAVAVVLHLEATHTKTLP
jgi:hypothetical protein